MATPSDPTMTNKAAIWPGLQESPTLPLPQNSVLQNYCYEWVSSELKQSRDRQQQSRSSPRTWLQHGDVIKSVFVKDTRSETWTDSVWITRGPESIANGQSDFEGSFQFDPAQHGVGNGPYQEVVIAVEPHPGFQWDFGEVVFQDILIEAQTQDTS
ncbi:uncharacterized protein PAC_18603 [Phialocephala subalpina]|uniref:Uncharacterized protein n=1 Tax=Phialocephala subalpina TaxID=576137 RepID=A0A1L7XUJ7_9HELO|nr:uncharacterized protein PAC_18603 [Phialocephala subalpina]